MFGKDTISLFEIRKRKTNLIPQIHAKYFSEVKIGEIVKLVYASYIREGHDLIIRDSEEKD